MKLLILSMFVALLSACASTPAPTSEFAPFLSEFHNMFEGHEFPDVNIHFGEVQQTTSDMQQRYGNVEVAAECRQATWAHRTPEVVIDERVWDRLSAKQQRELILHELGHCLLGLKHSTEGFMKPVLTEDK